MPASEAQDENRATALGNKHKTGRARAEIHRSRGNHRPPQRVEEGEAEAQLPIGSGRAPEAAPRRRFDVKAQGNVWDILGWVSLSLCAAAMGFAQSELQREQIGDARATWGAGNYRGKGR